MGTPAEEYQASRRRLDEAQALMHAMSGMLTAVSMAIDRDDIHLTFTGPGIDPLPNDGKKTSMAVEAQHWPTAEMIQAALQNMRAAKAQLLEAWEKVPLEERGGLKAPMET